MAIPHSFVHKAFLQRECDQWGMAKTPHSYLTDTSKAEWGPCEVWMRYEWGIHMGTTLAILPLYKVAFERFSEIHPYMIPQALFDMKYNKSPSVTTRKFTHSTPVPVWDLPLCKYLSNYLDLSCIIPIFAHEKKLYYMLVLQDCINKLADFKTTFSQRYGITKLGIFGITKKIWIRY